MLTDLPDRLIITHDRLATPSSILPYLESGEIDAIEIHTQVGHLNDFQRLWQLLCPRRLPFKAAGD